MSVVIEESLVQGVDGAVVEMIVAASPSAGGAPAVLLMHGHQDNPRPGAHWAASRGLMARIVAEGWTAAAVSMPGYGQSAGQPDFCGPRSQAAVRVGLRHLRERPGVDPERIALCGWSRGAIVSSMVATAEPDLRAMVLAAGIYDLTDRANFVLTGIHDVFLAETAGEAGAAIARSAVFHADQIRVPTLILHGDADERASVRTAVSLHRRLAEQGCTATLGLLPGTPHRLPEKHVDEMVIPFLRRWLDGGGTDEA